MRARSSDCSATVTLSARTWIDPSRAANASSRSTSACAMSARRSREIVASGGIRLSREPHCVKASSRCLRTMSHWRRVASRRCAAARSRDHVVTEARPVPARPSAARQYASEPVIVAGRKIPARSIPAPMTKTNPKPSSQPIGMSWVSR